jgi:hypothetical protein
MGKPLMVCALSALIEKWGKNNGNKTDSNKMDRENNERRWTANYEAAL